MPPTTTNWKPIGYELTINFTQELTQEERIEVHNAVPTVLEFEQDMIKFNWRMDARAEMYTLHTYYALFYLELALLEQLAPVLEKVAGCNYVSLCLRRLE